MKKFLFLLLISIFASFADQAILNEELAKVEKQIKKLDEKANIDNIWIKRFFDHKDFLKLKSELLDVEIELKKTAKRYHPAKYTELEERKNVLEARIQLLGEIGASPYEVLIRVDQVPSAPEVRNPFAIISALSFIKENSRKLKEHSTRLASLKEIIEIESEKIQLLRQKLEILEEQKEADRLKIAKEELAENNKIYSTLSNAYELFDTAFSVQEKLFAAEEQRATDSIKTETVKLVNISIVITIIILLMFLIKLLARRVIEDTNRLFSLNRAINSITFLIVLLVLLFNYIYNIVYFVTLLGFISAGIAIALKDWFMSLLGWVVISFGGSIHIGDRLRVVKDGDVVVGDVLEVGLTRLVLYEDISLVTYDTNRRAGRIVHIPNNYIFTHMIQNYTFGELKTVWDGVDVVISFDSNIKKAQKIAKEIANKHAKGYSDITKKHYAALRSEYNFRAISVEPRVFAFVHTYGVKISIWFLANSYTTMALRSLISSEIVEAFVADEDIKIAYPTYVLGSQHFENKKEITPNLFGDEV